VSNNNPYTQHVLDNGLRIVIERMPDVRSAAAGFLARTGARDETPELAGVSHFLEHMMFKGTGRRTWRDITVDFDRMGSTYNAFTAEDRTFYYGWVRNADVARQIELLADMMRSRIPPEEFETEKNVILEEIAMSKDHLEHVAYEFVQEKVFAGHPLAWPILGYEQTVRDLTREQMWAYFQQRYAPDNLMLIVAGNVDPREIIGVTEECCGDWKPSGTRRDRRPPAFHDGRDTLVVDRFQQQVVSLSWPSVGATHPLSETAEAAATILGAGDNSRFFWNIVQTGISPRAGAYYIDYEDFGLFVLFGACQAERAAELYDAMVREARRITREPVEPHEVQRVKNKRRTSLAVEAEAPYHRLTQLMEDMDYRGAPRTVDELLAEVDAVSIDSIREYFQQFPIDAGGHLAGVGPRRWPANGEG
jgi:predicted Zn-dependent peptidase